METILSPTLRHTRAVSTSNAVCSFRQPCLRVSPPRVGSSCTQSSQCRLPGLRKRPVVRDRCSVCVSAAGLHPASRSFKQWWADTRQEWANQLDKKSGEILGTPLSQTVTQWQATVKEKLHPIFLVCQAVSRWWDRLCDSYDGFNEEECKRAWKWQRNTELQLDFWLSVRDYITMFVATIVWEAFIPVSVFWAIIVPSHIAWIMYDHWWLSPIFVGMLVIMPMKFVPGCPMRWF